MLVEALASLQEDQGIITHQIEEDGPVVPFVTPHGQFRSLKSLYVLLFKRNGSLIISLSGQNPKMLLIRRQSWQINWFMHTLPRFTTRFQFSSNNSS